MDYLTIYFCKKSGTAVFSHSRCLLHTALYWYEWGPRGGGISNFPERRIILSLMSHMTGILALHSCLERCLQANRIPIPIKEMPNHWSARKIRRTEIESRRAGYEIFITINKIDSMAWTVRFNNAVKKFIHSLIAVSIYYHESPKKVPGLTAGTLQ